ncbi:ras-related and estrogen-regulated growth inhibitor [Aplochiton taeniatus]
MADPGAARKVKLVVLGRGNTGKTALCVRFVTRRFIGDYDHKREVIYKCRRTVDQEPIDLEILDTVSQESGAGSAGPGRSLEASIRWADGVLLMYSVMERRSFDAVAGLKRLVDHAKQTLGVATVLVANKVDMLNGREVTTEEGYALAKDFRCSFYELSVAEEVVGVEAAVCQLARIVTEQQRHLQVMERRSRMLQMGQALRSKLRRSKTMQW